MQGVRKRPVIPSASNASSVYYNGHCWHDPKRGLKGALRGQLFESGQGCNPERSERVCIPTAIAGTTINLPKSMESSCIPTEAKRELATVLAL